MASSPFHVKERVIEAAYIREYARATSTAQDDTLVQHVKQYIPKDNPNPQKGDVTLIGAHANGFPKELYEPLWEHFYLELKKQGIRIRMILMADCAWQGQSGILNKDKLGNDPSWLDYMRDILRMIDVYRPPPPLVAVGHSFGGAAVVNAALFSPRLFAALVLLDPVVSRYASTPGEVKDSPAAMSIHRRDVWPSREAAAASFRKSPFYAAWDPRVLERWVQYGLVPVGTHDAASASSESSKQDAVTLATTKHQEVFTYLRPSWMSFDAQGKTYQHTSRTPDLQPTFELPPEKGQTEGKTLFNLTWPFYRPEPTSTLLKLPHVRPPAFYVFGGTSNLSPPEFIDEKLNKTGSGVGGSGGRVAGRVSGITHEKSGHLVPLEVPGYCAEHAAPWLKTELDRWWAEEKEYEAWTRGSQADKSSISEDFIKHTGRPDPRAAKKGSKDKAKL